MNCDCGLELHHPAEVARGYCEHCAPYPVCQCCLRRAERLYEDTPQFEGDVELPMLCADCYGPRS